LNLQHLQDMVAMISSSSAPSGGRSGELMNWLILFLVVLLIVGILVGLFLFVRHLLNQPLGAGRTWLDYGPLWIVGLGIVASLLGFLVVVLAFVVRTANVTLTEVLALLAALFGIIGTLVGTYFGIRTSLETHEGLLKLAQSSGNTQPPIVSVVNPEDGGEVADSRPPVMATFSKAMASATFNADTFKLALVDTVPPTPVKGTVNYDTPSWTATFTPSADLDAGTYQATVTTGVKDQEGTSLASDHTWKFEKT
jgi:hypothetical protein